MPHPLLRTSALLAFAVSLVAPHPAAAQRRGAPGVVTPMTDVSSTFGDRTVTGRVDAKCGADERARPTNTRSYYVLMYPWFGQRVAPNKPQWRFDLAIRGDATTTTSDRFVFSFKDGNRSGTIQTVLGAERLGRGTVRITRHGKGARFDVEGRTKDGQPIRAMIDCSEFQRTEAPGG